MAADTDLRSKLDEALDAISSEFLRDYIRDLFDLTNLKTAAGQCPGCGRKLRLKVEKPDYKGIASALALLADQGKGKPKEASREDVRSVILEELKQLSTAELARIAAGGSATPPR